MKILSIPLGADTGGVSESIRRAFWDVPGWEFRTIISTLNHINYPRDLEFTRRTVQDYWRWADVLHRHHHLNLPPKMRHWNLPRRPTVLEFHGTGFREEPRWHLTQMRQQRAVGVVSTLDLWLLAPSEVEWLPCPIDIAWMQRRRSDATREQGVIRIAHAPTDRTVKSTDEVIDAVRQLQAEGYPVELDLIEGQTWDVCLDRKARADIYVDQVKLGYGNNAIEAWGMGIPVIAGAQPATIAEMERRFGELPFYRASEGTILDAIRALVESGELRSEYSQRGLAHVRRFHDEAVVVAQLQDIYTRAAGRQVKAA